MFTASVLQSCLQALQQPCMAAFCSGVNPASVVLLTSALHFNSIAHASVLNMAAI